MTAAVEVGRAVIDLSADANVLDAARRIDSAPGDADIVVAVPAGAPVARNAVFFEVLRRHSKGRRLVVVSSEARTRALAASVHIRSFASLTALERSELDPTERLTEARRAALATIAAEGARTGGSVRRGVAVFASLVAAAALLLAVVAPYATVVVTPTTAPLGPLEFDLRAGPGGDIAAQTRSADITAPVPGTASGSRTEDAKAVGLERFTNATTSDIRIPKGTVVRTPDNIFFQTTEDKVLPRSQIIPIFGIGQVSIAIEAIDPGPRGNVGADRISVSSSSQYTVTNPQATNGGDTRKIPVITQADYDAAVARADDALRAEGDRQLARWRAQAAKDSTVYGTLVKRTTISPASDVVGKEQLATFELTARGTATGYEIPTAEPRKTTIARLRANAPSENDVDEASASVDIVLQTVEADGVHWRVSGRGQQFARRDRAQMAGALAGRPFGDAVPVANARGFLVQRVSVWPGWWPRLPVLDSRITIEVSPPVAAP